MLVITWVKSQISHHLCTNMSDLNSKVIAFDVGGKILKISRDVIDQHPHSMLTRLISDTWRAKSDDPVFIDRDGDIFAQVLNYLRYGSITLPMTISKTMFLRDMEFYGIGVEVESIHEDSDVLLSKMQLQNNELATKTEVEELRSSFKREIQSSLSEWKESIESSFQNQVKEIRVGGPIPALMPGRYSLRELDRKLDSILILNDALVTKTEVEEFKSVLKEEIQSCLNVWKDSAQSTFDNKEEIQNARSMSTPLKLECQNPMRFSLKELDRKLDYLLSSK